MAVVLTVISVIAGGLLAYVNGVTEGPIQEIKAKALADGIKAVLQADEATVQSTDTIDGGVAIGFLTVVIRLFGAYPEGMSFAILLMNAFTPLINTYCKPKRFGEVVKK